MKKIVLTAVAAGASLLAGAAQAQLDTATSFRGFRVEGQAGGNRFQSQGVHDDKFAYGGAAGFDGQIGRIVIGPEFGFWRGHGENLTPGVAGGTVAQKSFHEYTADIRAGYLVVPKLLIFAQGGYANSEQRKSFTGVNGQGSYYNRFSTDGYNVGGGAEFSLTNLIYVGAGYRYSNYSDHTANQRVYGSVGVRFK